VEFYRKVDPRYKAFSTNACYMQRNIFCNIILNERMWNELICQDNDKRRTLANTVMELMFHK
jgi:hypothetical protein